MSTIDNKTLTNGIFLDTPGSYASPLTITSTGAIKAYGALRSLRVAASPEP